MIISNLFFYWLIVAFLFLLFELGNPGLFFFISFSLGAVAAAMVSLFSNSVAIHTIVFLVGTICSLFLLRTWVIKQGIMPRVSHRTNSDALQGKRGVALGLVSVSQVGFVKIGGEIWLAKSHESIEKGDVVEVIGVQGAHVVVKKII